MNHNFNIQKTGEVKNVNVKNVLSKHSLLFVNDSTLTENIISYVICHIKNSTSNLLNKNYRAKIKNEAKITEAKSKITGRKFAFSEKFDLHASFEN